MLKDELEIELDKANKKIEALELVTHVVAPENTLSDMITFENASEDELNQRELKRTYMRKRKLLYFQERLRKGFTYICSECGEEIDAERLILMTKAGICTSCADKF
ncbi:MAG: TraR/DksA C4-type zinc finger protein [Campylobacterota bacterium]|nr:TraR/DksA C4-type zinc finger protein [Campylobacterota bacterium]